jgi:putative Holliday junction resolvase
VDVGSVRIGVAASDVEGSLAFPLRTLDARADWLDGLGAAIEDYAPIEIVVGLPVSLDGRENAAAIRARAAVDSITSRFPRVRVRLVDERFTTTQAQGQLRASGVSSRKGRSVVDQVAASIMLQGALDTERATGEPPGTLANG